MPGKITEFIATVGSYGVAKTNRYRIDFPDIRGKGNDSETLRLMAFYANALTLPNRNVDVMPIRYGSKPHFIPTDFKFGDRFSITFLIDTRHVIKGVLEGWMQTVVDCNSNILNYYDDYVMDLTISELAPRLTNLADLTEEIPFTQAIINAFTQKPPVEAIFEEMVVARHKFINVYPVNIGQVTLSNDSQLLQTVTVEFAFEFLYSSYPQAGTAPEPGPNFVKKSDTLIGRLKNLIPQAQNLIINGASAAGGIVGSIRNQI
jgi:hypothetical protein